MYILYQLSIIILLSVSLSCQSLNILVYSPIFGGSHSNFMGNIADTLTERGHNVTFLVPVFDVSRRNYTGVRLTKNVIIVESNEEAGQNTQESDELDEGLRMFWTLENKPQDFATCFEWFINLMTSCCSTFLSKQSVIDQLQQTHFDIAIAEPISVCGLGLFSKLGIDKTIIASSTTQYEGVIRNSGEPIDLSYVPSHGSQYSNEMTIYERYSNWMADTFMAGNLERMFDMEMDVYRKRLGEKMEDWRELIPSASMFFTNSNPYIDFPRPIIQKTIQIGGITVDMDRIRMKKLTDEWNEILDRREKNMLISFGSMVKSSQMPIEWRDTIVRVIETMNDVTFIWKYESDDVSFANGIDNIHFSKWVPQTALLVDNRLTAFLTHGGLGSTNELSYIGKPAIMVPIFGDQTRNANMLARHGGVIVLKKFDLSNEEMVRSAINRILTDERYAENSLKVASLVENVPFKPKELVIKHTEFVAKYGPLKQLDPSIRQLNWFQYTFTDIYIIIAIYYFTITIIPLLIIYKLVRKYI